MIDSLAFHTRPDGRLFLAAATGGSILLWDPVSGKLISERWIDGIGWRFDSYGSTAFGAWPDGRLLLAVGDGDGTAKVWGRAHRQPNIRIA